MFDRRVGYVHVDGVTGGGCEVGVDDGVARRVGEAEVVREVFDRMPLIQVGYHGPEHTIVAASEATRTLMGRQDLIGLTLREAVPALAGQRIYEVADEAYATGRPVVHREWRIQMGHGGVPTDVYVDMHVHPAFDDDGRVVGVHGYAIDVTERVTERQAAQARATEAERRYQAARDVVAELQAALLPAGLPVLPTVDVAARYLVAGQEQAAGGDWFDAIPLPDGTLALVVGDVVGHGVAASAAMGQLRAVIAELLTEAGDLTEVLVCAERMASRNRVLRAATLCAAVLDPATGSLQYATCGHPPPLVITPGGETRYLPISGGEPLGTGSAHPVGTGALRPGEVLLLFSDGLVERPGRPLDAGMATLAEVAGGVVANRTMPEGAPASAVERVCRLSVELLTREGYDDDVTALAAQLRPQPIELLEREVPAVPGEVGGLQEEVRAWLRPLQPTQEDQRSLELAVTELVANAIEHAYRGGDPGVVRLRGDLGADGVLQLDVADDGAWQQPASPPPATSGRGLWLAGAVVDELQVTHPEHRNRSGGTVATLRHQLQHAAVLGAEAPVSSTERVPVEFAASLEEGPPLVLRVSGPVDISTAGRFAERLDTVSRGGVHSLTVHLTDVELLASAGVRVLFGARDRHGIHGTRLSLVAAAGSPADRVLDLVGLDHRGDASAP